MPDVDIDSVVREINERIELYRRYYRAAFREGRSKDHEYYFGIVIGLSHALKILKSNGVEV